VAVCSAGGRVGVYRAAATPLAPGAAQAGGCAPHHSPRVICTLAVDCLQCDAHTPRLRRRTVGFFGLGEQTGLPMSKPCVRRSLRTQPTSRICWLRRRPVRRRPSAPTHFACGGTSAAEREGYRQWWWRRAERGEIVCGGAGAGASASWRTSIVGGALPQDTVTAQCFR
jgi:hypothetical protein